MRVQLALLLLGLFVVCSLAQTNCTTDDFEAQYTQCKPTNLHDLVWYKKRGVSCYGDPPEPIFDLPCNITCGQGEYLPLGSTICASCDPGSFTRGGGSFATEWNSYPTDMGIFSTYCANNIVANSPPINCSGWILTGPTIRSGPIEDAQSSFLLLQTQLLIAGVVRFSYRVDSEPGWDGLIFYVDDVVLLPKVSVTYVYVDFVANISAGYHTLRWEFYKDRSVSRGDDAAFIQSLEIIGVTYAESSCNLCEPGYYAPNSGSTQCIPCPFNTYTNNSGTSECSACASNEYSFVGATQCTSKVPCTANDYQILYGPCTSGNTRTATASWLDPKICDDSSFSLPSPTAVPCAACPPGTAQDASFNCAPCPTGTYSSGGGASCQTCGAGNSAIKIFNFSSFDSWPSGVSTSCTGYCGSNGWRLRSGFIDSGSGHGDMVDSTFTLNIALEQPGKVTFNFELNCTRFCTLYYLDYPYDASIQWNTTSIGRSVMYSYTTPHMLEIGSHNLTWAFEQDPYDVTPNNRTDAAIIYSIVITGTTIGGAANCEPCPNGTVAASASSLCKNCSAGYSSNPSSSACEICPGNTFSRADGDVCYSCGPTTTVNAEHTDCNDTCSFVINGLTYDLRPLAGKAYGPIHYDIYSYYINLCGRGGFVDACVDVNDEPLQSHVCQVLPYGYSLDVGWSSGYYSIPNTTAERGFRAHYDLGTLGCGPKNNGVAYPRSSDLIFICDPSAGLGVLETAGVLESPPCHYNFEWRSLYACPVCTADDYSFYYTTCGSNGRRTKMYYWKDPILCHDGVKLPASEQVSCSDSTVPCGVGQRLSDDGQSCVPCPVGQYSVGGGLLINSWPVGNDLPYEYTTTCAGACTIWESDDGMSIHSGFGTSMLTGSHSFRTNGTISFKYKVYAPMDGIFTFLVDGAAQLEITSITLYDYINFSLPLPAGSHVFQWKFENGIRYSPSLLTLEGVSIYSILVQGLDYHADSCLPCPDGTYSSSDPTFIGCVPCPADTYTTEQTDECTPCPTDQYSLPGSAYCLNKIDCTASSYVPVYTDCVNNTRSVSYTKVLPDTCIGGTYPPPTRQGIPCAPCPAFTISTGGQCQTCPPGKYFVNNECINNIPGYIVQYSQEYFGDDSESSFPAPFFTGCSGKCGSNGWRVVGAAIDSGSHASNAVDSYVGLIADFVFQGQITFTYIQNTTNALDGLQFSIDNVPTPIPVPINQNASTTVIVPIPSGVHTLIWNYHQEQQSGYVQISKIVLQGVVGAIGAGASLPCPAGQLATDPTALNCSNCPAGYYSPVAGSSACAPCAINTYNPYDGANECLACDAGSSTNKTASVQCETSCIFVIAGKTYNLTDLSGTVTVYDDIRRKFLINVCNNVGGSCPQSHACIVSLDGSVTEVGNSFRLAAENSSATPFSIYFEHGDVCPTSATNAARATRIQFQCVDDSSGSFQSATLPIFDSVDEDCLTTFNWATLSACRQCTDSDYELVRGVCSGGHRKMAKTRTSSCNGVDFITIPDESCSSREFPIGAILAIVFIFIAVIALAAFIFFRNRRLAGQYAALVAETQSTNVTL